MCKFCCEEDTRDLVVMKEKGLLGVSYWIAAYISGDKLVLAAGDGNHDKWKEVKINYCPKCGRNLKEE